MPQEPNKTVSRVWALVLIATIFAIILGVGVFNLLDIQTKKITKLETNLNQTNIILNNLINKTYQQQIFNQDVINWSHRVNNAIITIDNRTSGK